MLRTLVSCIVGRFFTICSVQFSHSVVSDSLWPHGLQHTRLPCPSLSHSLPEFAQTHVHWVGDAIQPSNPLLLTSPPAVNLSQHRGLFPWVSALHQVLQPTHLWNMAQNKPSPWGYCEDLRRRRWQPTPVLWPPDVNSWLIWKDPDAGKDWTREEKGMTGWGGWMASPTQWT